MASARIQHQVTNECVESILVVAHLIADAFRAGGKLLLCGKGASAAGCRHLATEFAGRFTKDFEPPGVPAFAPTTDTSILTAITIDCGFEDVFERQVWPLGRTSDVLITISASGNSVNVLRAVEAAHETGM
jgi:D-sedoheptulose 7-phosphate isomerase